MNGSDQADLWEKSERCPPLNIQLFLAHFI